MIQKLTRIDAMSHSYFDNSYKMLTLINKTMN